MNFSRRGLLRAIPALPLAGSEIKRHAAKLAGAGVLGGDAIGAAGVPMPGGTAGPPALRGNALVRLLKSLGGLPSWKLKEIRQQARAVRQLDPDIAALRSISLSAALRMQWARNEKRITKDTYEWHSYADERESFLKRHGIDWI